MKCNTQQIFFKYDYEDKDDVEEEVKRGEIYKLNQAITQISTDEKLQFICGAF
jgi:hypothetical protein